MKNHETNSIVGIDTIIKSEMIDTLDVSKITSRELDANLIRVINLDATSQSGDEVSFIESTVKDIKERLE